jgi:hypothetical protein
MNLVTRTLAFANIINNGTNMVRSIYRIEIERAEGGPFVVPLYTPIMSHRQFPLLVVPRMHLENHKGYPDLALCERG